MATRAISQSRFIVPSQDQYSLLFDGDDSGGTRVVIPAAAHLNSANFSLSAWFLSYGPEIMNLMGKSFTDSYRIFNNSTTQNLFEFDCDGDAVGGDAITYANSFDQLRWHHIVATFNASTKNRDIIIDGRIVTNPSPDTSTVDMGGAINSDFIIGAGLVDGPTYSNSWRGLIYDVQVYDTNLSLSQALDVYYLGKYGSNLVGRWLLNEGSGSSALDSSGYGNHGTIVGATYVANAPIQKRSSANRSASLQIIRNPSQQSVSPCDGFVRKTGQNQSFVNLVTQSAGSGAGFDATTNNSTPMIKASSTTDQFAEIIKFGFNFDTAEITSNGVISSATIQIYVQGKSNGLGDDSYVIVAFNPLSTSSVTTSDYNRFGSVALSDIIPYADITAGAYNTFTLNAAGIAAINKVGKSSFALFSKWVLDQVFGGTWASGANSGLTIQLTDAANRPKLTVNYTKSFTRSSV